LLKWLIVVAVTLIVGAIFVPQFASRMKLGRLPGDVTVRIRGKDYFLPFTTTLLLSSLATLLLRLL